MIEHLLMTTASTTRKAIVGGKMSSASAVLSGVRATQPTPLRPDEIGMIEMDGRTSKPYSLHETYLEGAVDVAVNDIITVDGMSGEVRGHFPWRLRVSLTKVVFEKTETL